MLCFKQLWKQLFFPNVLFPQLCDILIFGTKKRIKEFPIKIDAYKIKGDFFLKTQAATEGDGDT